MRRKGASPLGPPLEWLAVGFLPQMGVRGCPPFWDLWGSNPRAYIALGLKSNSLTTRTKSLTLEQNPYTRTKSLHSNKILTLEQNPYTRTKSLYTSLFCDLLPTAFVRLPSTSYCVCAFVRLPSTSFVPMCI